MYANQCGIQIPWYERVYLLQAFVMTIAVIIALVLLPVWLIDETQTFFASRKIKPSQLIYFFFGFGAVLFLLVLVVCVPPEMSEEINRTGV
ncbi:hypothetical protein ACFL2D_01855 [Patescibacteria group bacterium]